MHVERLVLTALALMLGGPEAWAGRPLSSDDASTTQSGHCQVESWIEGAGGDGAWVLAPACGIARGLELAADYTLPRHRDKQRPLAGLALKWVPEACQTETPVGNLNCGLKLLLAHELPADGGWHGSEASVLGLATLQASDDWAVHVNLGAARDRSSGSTGALFNLAVVWTPHARALLFAETLTNNRHAAFGAAVNSAGARWWLAQDLLGLDLTASRSAGSGGPTRWTVGLGWYGLSF